MTQQHTVAGRYELGPLLERAGSSDLYRARDLDLGRDVAIRILRSEPSGAPRGQRINEATRAAIRVLHPNVLTVYDAGLADGRTFLVLELPPATSLADALDGTPMGTAELSQLGLDVLAGLEAVHDHGLLLGDLAPASVFRADDGRWKIPGAPGASPAATPSDPALDPAAFRAPEFDERGATRATDLFTVGALLFAAATGNAGRRSQVELVRPDLDLAVAAVIGRAIERDPVARFDAAAQMAAALRAARPHAGPVAPVIELTRGAGPVLDLTGPSPVIDLTLEPMSQAPISDAPARVEPAGIPRSNGTSAPPTAPATEAGAPSPPPAPMTATPPRGRRRRILLAAVTVVALTSAGLATAQVMRDEVEPRARRVAAVPITVDVPPDPRLELSLVAPVVEPEREPRDRRDRDKRDRRERDRRKDKNDGRDGRDNGTAEDPAEGSTNTGTTGGGTGGSSGGSNDSPNPNPNDNDSDPPEPDPGPGSGDGGDDPSPPPPDA